MNGNIMSRLKKLEARNTLEVTWCMVELPDGTERETRMDEWYEHRQEWKWKRMTKGSDPEAVKLLIRYLDEECT